MKIRLIGVGKTGEEVVRTVTSYFSHKGIESLLEGRHVVLPTTDGFVDTYTKLRNVLTLSHDQKTVNLIRTPLEERYLRSSLGWLFFDSYYNRPFLTQPQEKNKPPQIEDRHWQKFFGRTQSPTPPNPPPDESRADLAWLHADLFERIKKVDGLMAKFMKALETGFRAHADEVAQTCQTLGNGWLVTPSLPLVRKEFTSGATSIGEELMKSVLAVEVNHDRLLEGLGEIDCDVDIVAVAFSAGDSFGCGGAETLAQAVRRVLQYPDANRIVAIVGLALYNRGDDTLNGRCVGQYLRLQNHGNGFDGLIARPLEPDEPQAVRGRQRVGTATAYARMLAGIAMASDPKMIQVDNPDANQLQRDFGKRLFSSGYADVTSLPAASAPAVPAGGAATPPMRLVELYDQAKEDLFSRHCHYASHATPGNGAAGPQPAPFPYFRVFREEASSLAERVKTWRKPAWVGWLESLGAPGPWAQHVGKIETGTARKVIAYVGHNGKLDGAELQSLRARIAKDFPRARTVVYKYSIMEVETWVNKPPAAGTKSAKRSWWSSKPAGADPTAAATAIPPQFGRAGGIDAHLMLFVVDSFETNAVAQFWHFIDRRMRIREQPGDEHFLDHRDDDKPKSQRMKSRLATRALLSVPSASENRPGGKAWEPRFREDGKLRTLSCVTDSILGGADAKVVQQVAQPILELFGPEYMDRGALEQEAQALFATAKKVRVFLVREAEDRQFEPSDVADVLCGLNLLCNEELETRLVVRTLAACVEKIHKPEDTQEPAETAAKPE